MPVSIPHIPAHKIRFCTWRTPLLLLLLVGISLSGCGDSRPRLVRVEGTVTVNGEPIQDAQVIFEVDQVEGEYARPSTGQTDASGKFILGTYTKEDGLPMGTYKVGIVKRELLTKLPENHNTENPLESARPLKYRWITPRDAADPSTSGLTAEVTSNGLEPAIFALEGGGEVITVGADGNLNP